MRFSTQCEKEGCESPAQHVVVDWTLGWLRTFCDEHEQESLQNGDRTSAPIPFKPPPTP